MAVQSDQNSQGATRPAAAVRMFGRYQLLRLLGKSERTMAWAVAVPRTEHELAIVLPRTQPAGAAALERWTQAVQRAGRLNHPNLASPLEIGVQDGWPFAAYEMRQRATWAERLPAAGWSATELAPLALQALSGLAFAHEGGVGHHDVQPYLMLLTDSGQLEWLGLEVGADEPAAPDGGALRAQRHAAEQDVLGFGFVMHHALAGKPALDEPDVGRVIARVAPLGRDIVRLPWTLAQPVPDPLRAIVNRATDRQERQRYRSARTLARAIEGWQQADAVAGGGPLALLGDRLRHAGVLPSQPGAAARAARLAMMEHGRTNELADVVLHDLALSFELLRAVNSAQVRGAQVSGSGPVLTLRRAIAMVGLEGVRRAALALREWPGPLDEAAAGELQRAIARAKRAGRLALALRPAGYDAEVVYLVTLLQNLGRLVVHYHFAEEAQQIRRLMLPAPSGRDGEPDDPGMSEEGAAFAVLGADIESLGAAVARHWGLDDSVLHMMRRLPLGAAVHAGENDDEMLRIAASAANEAVDALALPQPQVPGALQRVVQRYGRLLDLNLKSLHEALQASQAERAHIVSDAPAAPQPADEAPAAAALTAVQPVPAAQPVPPAPPVQPVPGGLRAAASLRAKAASS